MTQAIQWQTKLFSQLTTNELYDCLKLRIDVFVVEQTCYYSDLDDIDKAPDVLHHFAYDGTNLVGYCRLLPPHLAYPNMSAIGRVIINGQYRGQNLGKTLMNSAIAKIHEYWPQNVCHISAQQHLSHFYNELGFEQVTDMYLEDGIPHIGMELQPSL